MTNGFDITITPQQAGVLVSVRHDVTGLSQSATCRFNQVDATQGRLRERIVQDVLGDVEQNVHTFLMRADGGEQVQMEHIPTATKTQRYRRSELGKNESHRLLDELLTLVHTQAGSR